MLSEQLVTLKAARDLLDRAYVKWTADDGKGGHCALGCLQQVEGGFVHCTHLNTLARVMFPEHVGKRKRRMGGRGSWDEFNFNPLVYVNNQLGKEATLALFDRRIADLEAKLATPVPADWKVKETVNVCSATK